MRRVAQNDLSVSHLFIIRRDRLARPDLSLDGVALESEFRSLGLTIVMYDKILQPLSRNKPVDIGELITSVVEYDASGKFRLDLAQKILLAQVRGAKAGHSIGGTPPYDFERWQVGPDNQPVRKLAKGEYVKQAGHHMEWLPRAEAEIEVVLRIFDLVETTPVGRIANLLTQEGISPPQAGNGKSGIWHPSTVRDLIRNKLYIGLQEYGKRSVGDRLRFTPDGPRSLDDRDFTGGKMKKVLNPLEQRIVTKQRSSPLIEVERFQQVGAKLDERSKSTKGTPRTREQSLSPLGGRVFDVGCGWPMYRINRKGEFAHTCALYQQSYGKMCHHNILPGPQATRFVLGCIRQRMLCPTLQSRLEARLRELATAELGGSSNLQQKEALNREQVALQQKISRAQHNLALATSDEQFAEVSRGFDNLVNRGKEIEMELGELEKASPNTDIETEVRAAMQQFEHMHELTSDLDDMEKVTALFQELNAKVYVRYKEVSKGRRTVNQLVGGTVTFGNTELPV